MSGLILINKEEKSVWMEERMAKMYSFTYIKGSVDGEEINVAIECVEDGDIMPLVWEKETK